MIFGCDQPNAFSDDHLELMTAIGTQATVSLQNAVLYQNLKTEKEKIVEVEEDARKKLSRDLHDGPTQSVAAIAMRVNYIRRLIERQPQQAIEELWKVEELARRTTKEIRHMLFTLRPLVLETQGLLPALGQLAEKMRDTHDTNVVLQALPDVENYLDTNAQGVLFYVIEEAVNNARKHAESEHIWVRLYHRDQRYVVVEIEDDGKGFDVQAVDANYDQRGSLGMINMRERAELIEGTARVQSAPGRGTKITVVIPAHPTNGAGALEEASESGPPLELQSHRAGSRTSEQVETDAKSPTVLRDTAPLTPPPTMESIVPPTPSPSSPSSAPPPPSRTPMPIAPIAPIAPASNPFITGGIEKTASTQRAETQEMKSANDIGQLFDSFANGGFTQPTQGKSNTRENTPRDAQPFSPTSDADTPMTSSENQPQPTIKRLGRAKRPQSRARLPESPPAQTVSQKLRQSQSRRKPPSSEPKE